MAFHSYFSGTYAKFNDFDKIQEVYDNELEKLRSHLMKEVEVPQEQDKEEDNKEAARKEEQKKRAEQRAMSTRRFNQVQRKYFDIVTSRFQDLQDQQEEGVPKMLRNRVVSIKLDNQLNPDRMINIETERAMLFPDSPLLWRKLEFLFKESGEKKLLVFSSRSRDQSSRRDTKKVVDLPLERVSESEIVIELPRQIYEKKLQIQKFTISSVTARMIAEDLNTSEDLTDLILKEYKRYMLLLAFFGSQMIYPIFVKQAWNFHLLDRMDYISLCLDCLEKKIHSFLLPSIPNDKIKEQYSQTLKKYKAVFNQAPNPSVWPSVEARFNYDEVYSYKLFNIRGYMSEILNKIEKDEIEKRVENRSSPHARHNERLEMRERKSALANMRTSAEPERGKGHILVRSVTSEIYKTVQDAEA